VRIPLRLKLGVRRDDRAGVIPHEAAPKLEVAEAHTRRLGQVLIEAGLITEKELAEALAEQAETGRLLGEILIARRLVSSPVLAQALAVQSGTELVVEQGFGAGLWARIERRHPSRRITVVSSPRPEEAEYDMRSEALPEGESRCGLENYPSRDALSERIVQQELEARDLSFRLDELSARVAALEASDKKRSPKPKTAVKSVAKKAVAGKSRVKQTSKSRAATSKSESPTPRRRPPPAA